ncbi:hypothetical protein MTP99_011195 [Tenebrio molitor]|nr:hypothetical protein MTP99_011195 [Tenebrio molitor]
MGRRELVVKLFLVTLGVVPIILFSSQNKTVPRLVGHISRRLLSISLSTDIVPGTKWCGRGDIADSEDDLGMFSETDACCREHDTCPDTILANSSRHGFRNGGSTTISHCDCDEKFHKCLKEVDTFDSNIVGFGYFTFFEPRCYREDYPVVKCKQYKFVPYAVKKRYRVRCLQQEFNKEGEKRFQWFDTPPY